MNKQRFIERLNLYLDQELPAEESEKLLTAIRRNPEYHRIYLQYCQIFNSCSQFGEEFATAREKAAWRQKVYAIGGMAAAVALLGLAAQNLSPLIGERSVVATSAATSGDVVVNIPENTNAAETLPLLATSLPSSRTSAGIPLGRGVEAVSFDVGQGFESSRSSFTQPASIEFAQYSLDTQLQNRWARNFTLGEPVQASTFEHEAATAREGVEADISASRVDDRDKRSRLDRERAAAFGSAEARR